MVDGQQSRTWGEVARTEPLLIRTEKVADGSNGGIQNIVGPNGYKSSFL